MGKKVHRYSPARRLAAVRDLLDSTGGLDVYTIADRMGVCVQSARRYVKALEETGEPIYDEMDGKRKIWRLMPGARKSSITLTMSQMVSLFLSRRVFDFLEGTGIKKGIDEVFARLEKVLKQKDASAKNLDRKFFDVNEAPYKYSGREEDVDEIISALIHEQRLSVTHERTSRWQKVFKIDPYSLVVYKKGIYLAGYSHQHNEVRLFSIDSLRSVEWLKGDRFEYPVDYRPEQLVEGAFGLIAEDTTTKVRIFFDKEVSRFVRRRRWHPTQKIKNVPGGIEFSMEVRGTVEVESWVLSFGSKAKVLEPEELRKKIAAEVTAASALY